MATTNTKTFSLGTITYRMPNVVECMRLLGRLGFTRDMAAPAEGQEFVFISRLIENIEPFVTVIDAKKADVAITTWADAIEHREFLVPLTQIANEVMRHLNPAGEDDDRKNG